MRAADQTAEVEALRVRVRDAQIAAKARDCLDELEAFGTAASASQAVIVRGLAPLDAFVSNPQAAMTSYYKLVRAGARIPENNEFDLNRARVDGTINPFGVYENLQFAALSLNGLGSTWYGDYSITLRDQMIATRSTVFEENPFRFIEKYPVPPTGTVPMGHRASWSRRGELAMAKLHPRITKGMTTAQFPGVLLEQGTKSADSDFIEVHIYGAVHPRAVERVVGPQPVRKADQVIWRRVKKALDSLGAKIDEV